ncbi:MAG: PLP-dependent aminotransferase family protein, partial [Pseudomonadota bacterium]
VAGLAKTMGAGLRLAHLIAPSPRLLTGVSARLRAATVMACPLTTSLASRWIEGGVADAILTHIQTESRIRQHLVRSALPSETYLTDPNGFHVWIRPPAPWTRGRIVDWMRGQPLGAVAADAFCVGIEPPEALRLCLGGAVSREDAEKTLHYLADAFAHPPNLLQNAF